MQKVGQGKSRAVDGQTHEKYLAGDCTMAAAAGRPGPGGGIALHPTQKHFISRGTRVEEGKFCPEKRNEHHTPRQNDSTTNTMDRRQLA